MWSVFRDSGSNIREPAEISKELSPQPWGHLASWDWIKQCNYSTQHVWFPTQQEGNHAWHWKTSIIHDYILVRCLYIIELVQFSPLINETSLCNRQTIVKNHNGPKCRVVEPSPNWYICYPPPVLKVQGTFWKEWRQEVLCAWGTEVYCVSSKCQGNCTHEVSSSWLPKHDPNKDAN